MADVSLVSEDPTPLEYCPCCCKMFYVNDADKGLAPVVWRKTEHCLKQTWLWRCRERRGKYAGKSLRKDYDMRSWTGNGRFYGRHILRPDRKKD